MCVKGEPALLILIHIFQIHSHLGPASPVGHDCVLPVGRAAPRGAGQPARFSILTAAPVWGADYAGAEGPIQLEPATFAAYEARYSNSAVFVGVREAFVSVMDEDQTAATTRGRIGSVVMSVQDLEAVVARSRAAAAHAGELTPRRVGPLSTVLPDDVRRALIEDLSSGEFRRAVEEAVADDPDLRSS